MRNEIIDKIRSAKENMYKKYADSLNDPSTRNQKTWWKIVKEFFQKHKSNSPHNKPLQLNGKAIFDDTEKANVLNNFFVSQTIMDTTNATLPLQYPLLEGNLSMINITSSMVKDISTILDPKKAHGPDNITPLILKRTAAAIAPILAKLFNFSLRTSTFPDKWKLANVTPIPKSDNVQECKNFRPISLLSTLSKVFERCVFKDVFNYLMFTKKLSYLQAAYIPNSSTEYQLVDIYNNICKAMDQGKEVRFVFCDVSKAFDRVWHKGIIHKLEVAGIGGKLLSWFESYLSSRKQRVILNGCQSSIKEIYAGVPQGSILGPLLFLIYINDITDVVKTNIRLYADDSSIFVIGNDKFEMARELNTDIERVTNWGTQWLVNFNPSKTISVNFTSKPADHTYPLYMNNSRIKDMDNHKHLGCILQSNGKWNLNIQNIISKCTRQIDILRGLKYKLDRKTLETIYVAFIRPHMEYANIVWTNCTNEQLNSIENLQLSAIRVITGGIGGTSHNTLYQECRWETTFSRREKKQLNVYYKMVNHETAQYLIDILPPTKQSLTNHNLRNKHDRVIPTSRTVLYSNSFIPSITRKWNDLPMEIKQCGSLTEFKSKTKSKSNPIPKFFFRGNRKSQIILAQLRMKCSPLKAHLSNMHIIEDKKCDCGNGDETMEHYFNECPRYDHIRHLLQPFILLTNNNIDLLVNGTTNQNEDTNRRLFEAVSNYIEQSKRFWN